MYSHISENHPSCHGKHSRLVSHQDALRPITAGLVAASPNLQPIAPEPAMAEGLSRPHHFLCVIYTNTHTHKASRPFVLSDADSAVRLLIEEKKQQNL